MSNLQEKAIEWLNIYSSHKTKETDIFIAGYELCQKEYEEKLRWIPVEKELPEKYQNVLLKEDSGSIYVGFYGGKSNLPICRATESRLIAITHWRPIYF